MNSENLHRARVPVLEGSVSAPESGGDFGNYCPLIKDDWVLFEETVKNK